ncbi:MAG: hypothetical protein OXF88_03335 [Rhodobacteraceae bacterium]|nr:hypothetical protein [Paracoccaceae bacterium]
MQEDGFADCFGLPVTGFIAVLCEDESLRIRERFVGMVGLRALVDLCDAESVAAAFGQDSADFSATNFDPETG